MRKTCSVFSNADCHNRGLEQSTNTECSVRGVSYPRTLTHTHTHTHTHTNTHAHTPTRTLSQTHPHINAYFFCLAFMYGRPPLTSLLQAILASSTASWPVSVTLGGILWGIVLRVLTAQFKVHFFLV